MNAFIDTNGVLTCYGFAESNNSDTLVVVPDTFSETLGAVQYVNGAWVPYVPPAAQLAAQLTAQCEVAAQSNLDTFAQSWGYDDIVSAASYANSTVAQFKAEAMALITWRDATWQAAETLLAGIAAGTTPAPATAAAFVATLPATPARPTA